MPHRLRDRHFGTVLEALIQYAAEGGVYSFESHERDGKLVISVTVDDSRAYQDKHTELMAVIPSEQP